MTKQHAVLHELAMEFAESCGTIALTTRDLEALKKLYIDFVTHVQDLLDKEIVRARRSELELHRGDAIGGGKAGIVLTMQQVEARIKQLPTKESIE